MNSPEGVFTRGKSGFFLIAAGVVIPLALLLFTAGYNPDANLVTNILRLHIPVHGTFAIPYRFPLAFCIFLIFLGIRKLDQSRRDSDKSEGPPVL